MLLELPAIAVSTSSVSNSYMPSTAEGSEDLACMQSWFCHILAGWPWQITAVISVEKNTCHGNCFIRPLWGWHEITREKNLVQCLTHSMYWRKTLAVAVLLLVSPKKTWAFRGWRDLKWSAPSCRVIAITLMSIHNRWVVGKTKILSWFRSLFEFLILVDWEAKPRPWTLMKVCRGVMLPTMIITSMEAWFCILRAYHSST